MRRMLLAAVVLLGGCDNGHDHKDHAHPAPSAGAAASKATDPVCSMSVERATAKKADFDNADYFFCSDACLKKFQAEPAKYAKACACAKTMPTCDCAHCSGKREPCDCH